MDLQKSSAHVQSELKIAVWTKINLQEKLSEYMGSKISVFRSQAFC